MLASASLGEDATLLDLLVEAAERALERLVLTHSDFGQSRFTSSAGVSHPPPARDARRRRGRPGSHAHTRHAKPAGRPPECTRGPGKGQTPEGPRGTRRVAASRGHAIAEFDPGPAHHRAGRDVRAPDRRRDLGPRIPAGRQHQRRPRPSGNVRSADARADRDSLSRTIASGWPAPRGARGRPAYFRPTDSCRPIDTAMLATTRWSHARMFSGAPFVSISTISRRRASWTRSSAVSGSRQARYAAR